MLSSPASRKKLVRQMKATGPYVGALSKATMTRDGQRECSFMTAFRGIHATCTKALASITRALLEVADQDPFPMTPCPPPPPDYSKMFPQDSPVRCLLPQHFTQPPFSPTVLHSLLSLQLKKGYYAGGSGTTQRICLRQFHTARSGSLSFVSQQQAGAFTPNF
jgi:hypothetical protein